MAVTLIVTIAATVTAAFAVRVKCLFPTPPLSTADAALGHGALASKELESDACSSSSVVKAPFPSASNVVNKPVINRVISSLCSVFSRA